MKTKILLTVLLFVVMHASNAQLNGVFIANGDTVQTYPFAMCTDSCYDFSIYVTNGVPPYTYLWNNGSTDEQTTYCTSNMSIYNDTIKVMVTSATSQSESFFIWTPNYLNINHEICIVTYDSASKKNMIVWEQNTDASVKHYSIYKETTTLNQYGLIGSVSRDSLSVFIDTTSNPAQVSAKYIMAASDGCVESLISFPHKTMHLSIYPGLNNVWNLIWTPYQGTNYAIKNRIWRGSTSMGLQLIDSVSASVTSYTDLTPPSGILFYAIEMIPQYICNPTSKSTPYSSSFSNTVDNADYVGIEAKTIQTEIVIMPNPAESTVQILSNLNINNIEIFDITGKLLYVTNALLIDFSKYESGVYFLRFKTEKGIIQKKIIKQ